jgi:hypothetical protein
MIALLLLLMQNSAAHSVRSPLTTSSRASSISPSAWLRNHAGVSPGVIANVRAIKQDKILTHQYVAKDDRLIVKFIVGGVHECNRAFSGMLTDFAQLLGILSKFSRVVLTEIVPNRPRLGESHTNFNYFDTRPMRGRRAPSTILRMY